MENETRDEPLKQPPHLGDYELARAKRQLEKLLRREGASKRQALEEVSKQFSPEGYVK